MTKITFMTGLKYFCVAALVLAPHTVRPLIAMAIVIAALINILFIFAESPRPERGLWYNALIGMTTVYTFALGVFIAAYFKPSIQCLPVYDFAVWTSWVVIALLWVMIFCGRRKYIRWYGHSGESHNITDVFFFKRIR